MRLSKAIKACCRSLCRDNNSMRNSLMIVVLLILVFACSILIKRVVVTKKPGSCLYVRAALLHKTHKTPDMHIPQCTLYGNYYRQQCDVMESTCWCVTPQGARISGTLVRDTDPSQCQLNWLQRLLQRVQS